MPSVAVPTFSRLRPITTFSSSEPFTESGRRFPCSTNRALFPIFTNWSKIGSTDVVKSISAPRIYTTTWATNSRRSCRIDPSARTRIVANQSPKTGGWSPPVNRKDPSSVSIVDMNYPRTTLRKDKQPLHGMSWRQPLRIHPIRDRRPPSSIRGFWDTEE